MTTLLDHALQYAAQGWRVFPCHTPVHTANGMQCSCRSAQCGAVGKHPRTLKGFTDASSDPAQITKWWTMWPEANIGGTPGSAGLVAFDLDSDASLSAARALGLFAEPTFEVETGNGVHRYYRSQVLPSGATVDGIVVRSNHGYVLLPPSLHASGRHYTIRDHTPPATLPEKAARAVHRATSKEGARERVLFATSADRIAPGDRHGALLALAGSLAAANVPEPTAAQLVQDANTARCDPPKPRDEVANIVVFAYQKERERIGDVARHLIIAHAPQRPVLITTPTPAPTPLDAPLPGVLEELVQWVYQTAPQPVRLYAVAAALAVASTLCARRFATSKGNYSTLYLLVVGKSGTGKEHVRRASNALLRAVGAPELIGPNEWTSRSAVWSSVYTQPQSLAIVDEFGQFLGAASGGSDGAAMKNGVLTVLMELFGRVDDFAITPQFSTLTLAEKQRKAAERKVIERPALTVTGLTTPDEWYGSLRSSRISSGFLNRFLVLHADVPRGDLAVPTPTDPPTAVVDWGRRLLAPRFDLDTLTRVTEIPPPTVLAIDPAAEQLFVEFRRECNRRADRLESERLGELPVRAAEQGLRLALIAALARDPAASLITPDDTAWGIAVASSMLDQLIPSVQERLADSPVHALRNRLIQALKEAGPRGLTQREMARSPVFRGTDKRNRDETIQWVQEAGHAAWGDVEGSPTGGRPRYALISTVMANEEAA